MLGLLKAFLFGSIAKSIIVLSIVAYVASQIKPKIDGIIQKVTQLLQVNLELNLPDILCIIQFDSFLTSVFNVFIYTTSLVISAYLVKISVKITLIFTNLYLKAF